MAEKDLKRIIFNNRIFDLYSQTIRLLNEYEVLGNTSVATDLQSAPHAMHSILGLKAFQMREESELRAAALISSELTTRLDLNLRLAKIADLRMMVHQSRGQHALWFCSETESAESVNSTKRYNSLAKTVGIGRIDSNAFLELDINGDIVAPVVDGIELAAGNGTIGPASNLDGMDVWPKVRCRQVESINASKTVGGVLNFVLVAGTTAVADMIQSADNLVTRKALEDLQASI